MGYQTVSTADVDSVIDEEYGGMWFLRDALGCENLGVTLMELEPGAKGKEHDHSGDGQEEIYCVVEGAVDVDFEDDTVTVGKLPHPTSLGGNGPARSLRVPSDEV